MHVHLHLCDKCEKEGNIHTYKLPFKKAISNIEYRGEVVQVLYSKETLPVEIELCDKCAEDIRLLLLNNGFKEV